MTFSMMGVLDFFSEDKHRLSRVFDVHAGRVCVREDTLFADFGRGVSVAGLEVNGIGSGFGGPRTITTIAAYWVTSKTLGGLGRRSSVSAAASPAPDTAQPTRHTSRGQVPTALAVWLCFHAVQ